MIANAKISIKKHKKPFGPQQKSTSNVCRLPCWWSRQNDFPLPAPPSRDLYGGNLLCNRCLDWSHQGVLWFSAFFWWTQNSSSWCLGEQQMRKGIGISSINDEQMSNKVRVEHLPVFNRRHLPLMFGRKPESLEEKRQQKNYCNHIM